VCVNKRDIGDNKGGCRGEKKRKKREKKEKFESLGNCGLHDRVHDWDGGYINYTLSLFVRETSDTHPCCH